jgi:putative peptidoglycan lipid II flippase
MSPDGSVSRRLGLAALLMAGSVFLSRIIGYLRDAIIAARHGADAQTDVYFAAFTLPDLMNYLVAGGALSITFIPIFSRHLAEGREDDGWRTFSLVATTVGLVLLGLTVLAGVFTEPLVRLLVPGFTDAQIATCVHLTRIVLPGQLAFYWGGLVQATLMAEGRFGATALVPLVYNGAIIAGGLLLDPWLGIAGFSWGALAGAWLGALGLPLWVQRRRLRFRLHFDLTDPRFVAFLKVTLPVMIGFSLVTVDEWIARWFASSTEPGSISWLNNARRLMMVPVSILGQAAGQAALPFLSRLWAEGRTDEMERLFRRTLDGVVFVTLAASTWMALHATPIVQLFFQRGRYDAADAAVTASLLALFSLGIVAWAVQAIAARLFYARHDTLTPMLVSSGAVLAALPVYAVLARWMGVAGLALATSLGMFLTAVATVAVLVRRTHALRLSPFAASTARSLATAALAGAGAWGTGRMVVPWNLPPWVVFPLTSAVFFASLVPCARLFGVEGIDELVDKVRRKLSRGRA